jgi:O-methyltransferase domain
MALQLSSPPSVIALHDLITSQRITAIIHVAARLGVADYLAGGAKSTSALVEETGTHERSLRRLLRALVTLGICKQVGKDQFELTAMGGHLAAGASQSLKYWALNEVELMPRLWGSLFDTIRAGKNPTTAAEFFGKMTPELATIFDQAMVEITGMVIPEVLAGYNFSEIARLIDVGGGYGQLLSAILNAYPSMNGAVFDLPRCAEAAKKQLAEARVSDRSKFIGGSFFEAVPDGADALVLKSVIHDWDDEQSCKILDNCRRALPTSGKLLLVERLIPEVPEANPDHCSIALSDLNMLALGGSAGERTEAEFRELLSKSRFRMTRVQPAGRYNVIEATVA